MNILEQMYVPHVLPVQFMCNFTCTITVMSMTFWNQPKLFNIHQYGKLHAMEIAYIKMKYQGNAPST
jgi:hypothetical protein